MTRKVVLTPRAIADLFESADYIAMDSPPSADRFLEAASNAFEMLARVPHAGVVYVAPSRGIRLRRWPVPRFDNYLIF